MNGEGNNSRLSLQELQDFMRQSGRALRHLHDKEYEQAVFIYRRLTERLSVPANVGFFAIACQESGRIDEAIAVLEGGVRDHPNEPAIRSQLAAVRERGYELLVRYAVGRLLDECSAHTCQDILARNESLADDTMRLVLRANAMYYAQQMNVRVLEALATLHQALCKRWGDDARRGDAQEVQGILAYVKGSLPIALENLREATAAARSAGDEELLTSCLNHLGLAATQVGSFPEAERAFEEAVARCESGEHPGSAARFRENLASMYLNVDPGRGLTIAADVERRYEVAGETAMALKARSLRAKCLASLGREVEALELLDDCIARGREAWSQMPIVMADAMICKANILEDQLRLAEAEEVRVHADAIYRRTGAPVVHSWVDRSGVARRLNRYEEGIVELKQHIGRLEGSGKVVEAAREKMNLAGLHMERVATRTLPGADPDDSELVNGMKGIEEAHRLLDEAVETLARCQAPFLLAGARERRANLRAVDGSLFHKSEMIEAALIEYDDIIQICRRYGFMDTLPRVLENKAQALSMLGRDEDSRRVFDERLAISAGRIPTSSYGCRMLGKRLFEAGNDEEALRVYERALEIYDIEESRLRDAALTIDWSRSNVMIFDEVIQFFANRSQWESAFAAVQRAKARTFRRLLVGADSGAFVASRAFPPAELAMRLEQS